MRPFRFHSNHSFSKAPTIFSHECLNEYIGRVNINVTLLFDSNKYKMRIVLTLIADVFEIKLCIF